MFWMNASKKITSVIDSLRVIAIATPPRRQVSVNHHLLFGAR
jgi:hypothetical protein